MLASLVDKADLGSGPPRFRSQVLVSKKGKRRTIYAANATAKRLHRMLLRYVRKLTEQRFAAALPFITSRKGSSFFDNVQRHAKPESRYFYCVDLVRAYHGVNWHRLVGILASADRRLYVQPGASRRGREREIFNFLKLFCFDEKQGGLMEGPPASPDLFNLYCAALLDRQIGEIATRHGLTYTRYVDDLTFSAAHPISEEVRKEIRAAIKAAGFWVNHKRGKSIYLDLYAQKSVLVTGVRIITQGPEKPLRLFLSQRYLRRIQEMLERALTNDLDEVMSNDEQDLFHRRLRGLWQIYRQTTLQNERRTKLDKKLVYKYNLYESLYAE